MYLNNYKNKDGIMIFSGMANEIYASLAIDGNKQKMTLPRGKWKNVTTRNDVEIIEYADSEGNLWDLSYGTDFPYSYKELNKELLSSLISIFEGEIQELAEVSLKIQPIVDTLSSKFSRETIKTSIGNQIHQLQNMVEEIKRDLNAKSYEGIEDEVMCESEVEDYGRGAIRDSLNGFISEVSRG